ncbi:P-loop containing nucleoside triphosphate hydrolase protein [Mycena alexandri]|uniref:P-loop containing nucleoside triphosphate hydrolase protein n=1 Tax=Mycena alexandri TaxID=1745969 RepID=A0AAD6TNT6_9AGAR|nr:P-loop containing nucleoside triphosphate hydrolase protein [Mycena alexandri]
MAFVRVLCPNSNPDPFALSDACIRASWSALVPTILVCGLCTTFIPVPAFLKRFVAPVFRPFQEFLTLEEAEAFLSGGSLPAYASTESNGTTSVLCFLALVEILLWSAVGISEFVSGAIFGTGRILPFLFMVPWVYSFLRPLMSAPIITAPMDLFWLFSLEFTGDLLLLGGLSLGYGTTSEAMATVLVVNTVLTVSLFVFVLRLPLGIPSREPTEGELEPAPEDYTSLFGWITFAWVFPLIRRGTINPLTEKDVWNLSPTMQARSVFHKFAYMNLILATLEHPVEGGRRLAYLYALLGFACMIAKSETDVLHFYYGRRASTRMRTELMVAVYEKALKRRDLTGIVDAEAKAEAKATRDAKAAKKDGKTPSTSKASSDGKEEEEDLGPKAGAQLGKIVNLMSVDAATVCSVPFYLVFLYGAPFEIAISLGWAAFSGMFFVILSIPLNYVIAKLNVKYEKGIVTARDKRTGVLNELISSIKFIKLGGAEERWLTKANDARDVELTWLVKSRFMEIAFHITWMLLPVLISVSSFYVYVKQGNDLTVATAFTFSAPLSAVPYTISFILQGNIALARISKFLDEDEVPDQVSALKSTSVEDAEVGLVIENGSFKWNELAAKISTAEPSESAAVEEETRFELRDISVSFPEGKLTCVVGPTASGKTALLLALLGEMTCFPGTQVNPPKSSRVDENGLMRSISYSAQTPWLQYATIKDNITFGFPFDEERYKSVLEACALLPDLAILPDGDRTEIGVRGVSLSVLYLASFRRRVALARAVYAWTKYDSHTARILFDKLFCGPLLRNRTVVLVTHHLDLLLSGQKGSGAHYIVRMLDGRIDAQGTVKDLRAHGVLEAIKPDSPASTALDEERPVDNAANPLSSEATTKLVKDEEQAKGDVEWRIYKTYFKASSYRIWMIVVLLVVFIEVWGEASQITFNSSFLRLHSFPLSSTPLIRVAIFASSLAHVFPPAQDNPMFYVGIYAAIGFSVSLVNASLVALHFYASFRASRRLFRNLLRTVVYSTFRWFDTTPKGRILNRVGKDISSVDTGLSQSMTNFTYTMAALAVAILTIAVVFPYFLLPGLLLSFAYYKLSVGYLHSSRDLRRMEANTRSPIFTGFSELLEGIVTVRAFGVEKVFLNEMYNKVDITTKSESLNTSISYWQANRWLLLNFDYLGSSAVFVTSLLAVSAFVPAGLAGICITVQIFLDLPHLLSNAQVDLNAVERVVNYLEIPQEPPSLIESNRPPAYWPSSASNNDLVVVEDLEVKYAPHLPSVLHGISFALKARERVGLLGRTGSGKSTLATSLLRFVEPIRGRIFVDGIDISTIGLNELRTRLFVDEFEDAECQEALYRVHLLNRSAHPSRRTSARGSPVAELEGETATSSGVSSVTELDPKTVISLDTMVSAEGANFSHGQRQLIALARALLRQSSIIILDEATSSIDFETDQKIQTTIREEFRDSLLLTVAHRIKTVIDYDRLIILDQGEIAQCDTPYNLIRAEGIFREMCKKSGAFDELEAAARTASSALK